MPRAETGTVTLQDTKRRGVGLVLLLGGSLLAVILLAVVGIGGDRATPTAEPVTSADDQRRASEAVEILKQGGVVLNLDPAGERVNVVARMWTLLPQNTKWDAALAFTLVMGTERVDVIDGATGRKLGEYEKGGYYKSSD